GRAHPRVHRRAVHGPPGPRAEGQLRAVLRARRAALRVRARNGIPRRRDSPAEHGDRTARAPLAPVPESWEDMSRRGYAGLKVGAEITVPIAIVAAWQVWATQADNPKFPAPWSILGTFQDLWLFSEFGTHVVPSLERIALGF